MCFACFFASSTMSPAIPARLRIRNTSTGCRSIDSAKAFVPIDAFVIAIANTQPRYLVEAFPISSSHRSAVLRSMGNAGTGRQNRNVTKNFFSAVRDARIYEEDCRSRAGVIIRPINHFNEVWKAGAHMRTPASADVTKLLVAWNDGNEQA